MSTTDLSVLLDVGPRNYREAMVVRSEFANCARQALLVEAREVPAVLIRLNLWGSWLPLSRELVAEELRRLRDAPPTAIVVDGVQYVYRGPTG